MTMRRRNSHLVDPQFRRFVRMDIVYARRESHDQPIVNGNSYVMSRVIKKLPGKFGINRIIEDLRRDVHKYRDIAPVQDFDFDGHKAFASSAPPIAFFYSITDNTSSRDNVAKVVA